MSAVRIAQVGVRGFGKDHLDRIARLAAQGRCALVGVADPAGPLAGLSGTDGGQVPWFPTLPDLLAEMSVDVVSIATPIDTHLSLAVAAMRAGADVVLEKPPVPSLADFRSLLDEQQRTGRAVQIGFQSVGGAGVAAMRGLLIDGVLGKEAEVRARGCWLRDRAYYSRAGWAGRRVANGRRVADGVTTNPLSHAIQTALVIAGEQRMEQIASVTTELYHAHDIEADDTSFVRIIPVSGRTITAALTLCAAQQTQPTVELVGERGRAQLWYAEDRIELTRGGETRITQYGRTDLLENLLDHREQGAELICPLVDAGAFMTVLEATQDRPDPVAIDPQYVTWVGDGPSGHPVVQDIEEWLDASLASGAGLVGSGAPWGRAEAVASWTPAAPSALAEAASAH